MYRYREKEKVWMKRKSFKTKEKWEKQRRNLWKKRNKEKDGK